MVSKKWYATLLICSATFFMCLIFIGCHSPEKPGQEWKAPATAIKLKNPFPDTSLAQQKGQQLYNVYCGSCHGPTGYGDGAAGRELGGKPANFHEDYFKNESSGAIFWKLTTGRGSMPSFEKILSDEQRWQVVSYIQKFPDQPPPLVPPVALRDDIKIEHALSIGPLAVRILQNPVTKEIWYTTFDGDVFQIRNLDSTQPVAEKIFSVKDHGITTLQGAVFVKNTLFLCGNLYLDNKKSTMGRMVRFNLDSSKLHQMSIVFNTVAYGANKTIYDHGWNALVVSPDNKYLFVNSGARTDHGEIQDNGGAYPKARDNALTSKIFRFPVDAKDLLLTDDEAKLKADGYLFAGGIRNAYDLAFDPDGNLFGVSNSADYDYSEDMFWIREHHHYGFPWVMGGLENPQQYRDWHPDPDKDPFINKTSHSWEVKYYYNDTDFPKIPAGVKFSPGVQNLGPDANEYRGHTGKIQDGDQTGVTISTFTAHCCPLGLVFDTKKILSNGLKADGFVLRWSLGASSSLMKPFTNQGCDLLHLHMTYDSATDNFFVKTTRVVEGFQSPVDAIMIGNNIYIIEYGGKGGNIWKLIMPSDRNENKKDVTGIKHKP